MAREARIQSSTGMYHVMLRGINHQQIFEDEEDCYYMLSVLQNAQEQYAHDGKRLPDHCIYYAYALMGNHIHLLVHAKEEEIGDTIKRIASSYVYYYNRKYGRDGHLFKERFKSEPVEDMGYFLTLLRYIHQNPVKAKIVSDIKDYEFTSWHEYLGDSDIPFPVCNTKAVLNRISLPELKELVDTPLEEDVPCIEYEEENTKAPSDDRLLKMMLDKFGISDASELQHLPLSERDEILTCMLRQGGGVRQIGRLTGIGKNIVSRLSHRLPT